MDRILDEIKENINKIGVVDYNEEVIDVNTSFLGIKKGVYKLGNGSSITREGIFKRDGESNVACIFAVTVDRKILIVIQPRVALSSDSKINIELPAGYVNKNESKLEAGIRELEEETGYTSCDVRLVDSYYSALGFSNERIDLLLALDCIKIRVPKLDDDEFLCSCLVSLEEFEYLLNNNYIMDANARIGYYRYLEYLMKEGY